MFFLKLFHRIQLVSADYLNHEDVIISKNTYIWVSKALSF